MNIEISSREAVFFDFDGVIKESIDVKSDAFEELFINFGPSIRNKIREHHILNGGMSRYEKLPIYLEWCGMQSNPEIINKFANQFSGLVTQKVINSNWVDGIKEYIKCNFDKQLLFIVTATPEDEIVYITKQLKIFNYFAHIIGARKSKVKALDFLIQKYKLSAKDSVMIGDSITDFEAAKVNKVPFILRRTSSNMALQEKFQCQMIDDFNYE